MRQNETDLTPEQVREARQLKERLEELEPGHGHEATMDTSRPPGNEAELESLRNAVLAAEQRQRDQEPDHDRDLF